MSRVSLGVGRGCLHFLWINIIKHAGGRWDIDSEIWAAFIGKKVYVFQSGKNPRVAWSRKDGERRKRQRPQDCGVRGGTRRAMLESDHEGPEFHAQYNVNREDNGTPFQYSCLENLMDGGAWWAAVHGVAQSRTWLSDFPFTFHFHALEKGMATHSSVLAWRLPGMEEPSGLLSMGLHRVGHDWSDLAAAAAAAECKRGFPAGSAVKILPATQGQKDSPGGGHGDPL